MKNKRIKMVRLKLTLISLSLLAAPSAVADENTESSKRAKEGLMLSGAVAFAGADIAFNSALRQQQKSFERRGLKERLNRTLALRHSPIRKAVSSLGWISAL